MTTTLPLTDTIRRAAVAGMVFVAWVVAYADRIVIGTAIVPMAHDFQLSADGKGLVLGAFYLSYALMQIGGGALTDRLGARAVLIGSLAAWSAFTALTGLAWSLAALVVARLLFGLGEGGFSPASAGTIATLFPLHQRARLQALMGSTGFIGGAVGSAAMAWVVVHCGWRASFLGLAAAGLAVALGLAAILPPTRPAANSAKATHWRDVVRAPGFAAVSLLWFCACVTWVGVQSWMPSYLAEARHVPLVTIGLCAIAPGLAGFVSTNLAGQLLDLADAAAVRRLVLGAAALVPLCLAAMPWIGSTAGLVAVWSAYAMAFGPLNATVLAFPVKALPAGLTGRAMGLINFGGQIAGLVAALAVGRLVAWAGGDFTPAFLFLAALGVVGCGAALVLMPRGAPSPVSLS